MIVNAFGNSKVAAKYEAEIGALMAKTAKEESRRPFNLHVPSSNPIRESAQKKRDAAGPRVVECLLRHGPMARDSVYRTLQQEHHKFPRDAVMHALLFGKEQGFIKVAGTHGNMRWFICDERKAKAFLVQGAPARF